MIYSVTNEFVKINETSGTIQNNSQTTVEVSNTPSADTGILLPPLNKFSFNGETLYLRCVDNNFTEIRVVPFQIDVGTVSNSQSTGLDTFNQSDLDDIFKP